MAQPKRPDLSLLVSHNLHDVTVTNREEAKSNAIAEMICPEALGEGGTSWQPPRWPSRPLARPRFAISARRCFWLLPEAHRTCPEGSSPAARLRFRVNSFYATG